jgi:hypothetical protein
MERAIDRRQEPGVFVDEFTADAYQMHDWEDLLRSVPGFLSRAPVRIKPPDVWVSCSKGGRRQQRYDCVEFRGNQHII